MTAAGIALIAGGLATMIGFRRALWSGSGRRRAREPRVVDGSARAVEGRAPRAQRAIETSRRRAELSARPAQVQPGSVEAQSAPVQSGPPRPPSTRPAPGVPAQAGPPEISGAHAAADILAAATPESPRSGGRVAAPPAETPVAASQAGISAPGKAGAVAASQAGTSAPGQAGAVAATQADAFAATPDDVVAAVPAARGGRRGRRRGRSGAGRQSADHQGADRPGADRQGADRQGADRQGADRQGADRQGADRQGADRQGAGRPSTGRQGAGRPSTGGWAARQVAQAQRDEDERFGLAAIGLAGDDGLDGEIVDERAVEPDEFAGRRAADIAAAARVEEAAVIEESVTPVGREQAAKRDRAADRNRAARERGRGSGDDASIDTELAADGGHRLAVEVLHAELEMAATRETDSHRARDEPLHRRLARGVLARADEGTREGARFDLASDRLLRPHEVTAGEVAAGEVAASGGAASGVAAGEVATPGAEPADATAGGTPIGGQRSSAAPAGDPDDDVAGALGTAASAKPHARRRGHGDRVDGWIRPRYADQPDSAAGDYWTPVPDSTYTDLDGSDYGWPVPVERLPAVPSYPPASGFDVEPIEGAEPTAVVPQWPPAQPSGRIELPRAWSAAAGPVNRRPLDALSARRWAEADDDGRDGWRRNHGPEDGERWPAENGPDADRWDRGGNWDDANAPDDERWDNGDAGDGDKPDQPGPDERAGRAMWPADDPDQRPRRRSMMIRRGNRPDVDPPSRGRQAREARRRVNSATEHIPVVADSTQMLPQVGPGAGQPAGPEREGEPRRRPRPRPGPQAEARSTVYVSRHAAEPT
jgi:hypothetical protein